MDALAVGHVKLPFYSPSRDSFVERQVQATRPLVRAKLYTYDYVDAPAPEYVAELVRYPYARLEASVDHRLWRGGMRRLVRAQALRRLVPLARRDGVRVFHAHSGGTGDDVVRASRGRIPVVTSFYGYDASAALREDRRAAQAVFERGEKIVVLSDDMGRDLVSYGCPPEKLVVNHVWVDTDVVRPLAARPEGKLRVTLAGNHVEKKGWPDALDALARVKDEFDFVVDFTGSGPLTPTLRERATALGLMDRIAWHGRLPKPSDVLDVMARGDVFLAPSHTAKNGDKEGTPSVFIEAGALGLPSVGTIHAGVPEVVEHGVTGLLAPERDVPALAAHLRALLSDAALRRRMGDAARERMVASFSKKSEIPKLVALYRELAEGAPGRP